VIDHQIAIDHDQNLIDRRCLLYSFILTSCGFAERCCFLVNKKIMLCRLKCCNVLRIRSSWEWDLFQVSIKSMDK